MHSSAHQLHTKDREAEAKEKKSAIGRIPPSTSPLDSHLKISRNILRPTAPAAGAMERMPLCAQRECITPRADSTRLLGLRCVPAVAGFHESFQLCFCPTRRLHHLQWNTAQAADSRHRLEHRSSGAERGENRRGRPESRPRSPRGKPGAAHAPRTAHRRLQRRDLHDDNAVGAEEEGIPKAHNATPVLGLRHDLASAVLLSAQNVIDDIEHVIKADISPQRAGPQAGNRDFVTRWGRSAAREIRNEHKQTAPT